MPYPEDLFNLFMQFVSFLGSSLEEKYLLFHDFFLQFCLIQIKQYQRQMSQRESSEQNYGSTRSAHQTDRARSQQQQAQNRLLQTDRQIHEDSPTRHDIDFYVRKVNRYEAEIARLELDLSSTIFKLSKAEDFQAKYEALFEENQNTISDHQQAVSNLERTKHDLDRARLDYEQQSEVLREVRAQLESQKRAKEEVSKGKQELRNQSSNQGQSERQQLKEWYNKQMSNLKEHHRDIQDKIGKEIHELKSTIAMKETIENALNAKLEHIKREKNQQIDRLKELTTQLRNDIHLIESTSDERLNSQRAQLISQTEDRISNVRRLGQLIETTLTAEIQNLNATLKKKNDQTQFLTECDKKQLQAHHQAEQSYRSLIAKLENKIFQIQRENELELAATIQRLSNQYKENLATAQDEWEEIRLAHANKVDSLKKQIEQQRKEIEMLGAESRNLQRQHKEMAQEKEHSMQMLSQKILQMGKEKDEDLRNYTTSMKQIEDEAKNKLDDLHSAILNKNNEAEILHAQIDLKNGEISHLLNEINRLRDVNRQKLKALETTNLNQQNALNNQISAIKKQVFELKRTIHELENQASDAEAAFKLETELLKQQLQSQKEANALLSEKNEFLAKECAELDQRLKAERVQNVNILHDNNTSKRDIIQAKEEIRVQIEALKVKEIEQSKQVHRLEKNRLQSELLKTQHELRDKKEELGRLLVQYKALQAKVGKPSKVDRGADEEGKCRATLEAEIKLTENLFNAINTS